MTRALFTQEPLPIVLLSYSRSGIGKSTVIPIFLAAESALAETTADLDSSAVGELPPVLAPQDMTTTLG